MEFSSAMASASPSTDVEEEVKCPICIEYLTEPVTLDCGHNFCRGCISQYCEKWEDLGNLECPLCKAKMKKGHFRPNWQLANIVEKIKHLSFNLVNERLCVRHKEKLNLFCKDDQELVCLFCERSPEHRSHTVLLLEEAAEECRDKLCSCLEVLRMDREMILENKAGTEKKSQHLLGEIDEKKKRTVTAFNQLHQFLEEEKTFLLSQLDELEKEIAARTEEHMAILAEELSSLEGLIQQMEEQCQQPASEFLQDFRRTLQSYAEKEEFDNPVAFPPELICRIQGFQDVKSLLKRVMMQFEAKVTLDPDTAHPNLILSVDRKSVRWGVKYQDLPNNPERFEKWSFVLGREGFFIGKHFWEVIVGNEEPWAVGVARKSVWRKGWLDFSPDEGIWAVGKSGAEYRAVTSTGSNLLVVTQELKRIRVTLNCAEGLVAFSDADTGIHLYTHSGAAFCGEILLPFFYVADEAQMRLSL